MHTIESKIVLVIGLAIGLTLHVSSVPLADVSGESPAISTSVLPLDVDVSAENITTNSTKKDLYVIKAVVYEIGILTEVDENSTDEAYS